MSLFAGELDNEDGILAGEGDQQDDEGGDQLVEFRSQPGGGQNFAGEPDDEEAAEVPEAPAGRQVSVLLWGGGRPHQRQRM